MTTSTTGTVINQLEIELEADGTVSLTQDDQGFGNGFVTLNRCHLDVLAKMTGYVRLSAVQHATERLQDRLNLLAALIGTHTRPDDPLRAAQEAICPVSNAGKG